MKKQIFWITFLVAAASVAASAETINAAGATFPAPIYQKWFEEFHKMHSDIQVNYQSIGSGGGIRQLTEGTVDFGASDMPMTNEQIVEGHQVQSAAFPDRARRHRPTYNVPGAANPEFLRRYTVRTSTWAT